MCAKRSTENSISSDTRCEVASSESENANNNKAASTSANAVSSSKKVKCSKRKAKTGTKFSPKKEKKSKKTTKTSFPSALERSELLSFAKPVVAIPSALPVIPESQLNPYDVLVGRGNGIAKNPGNIFFRCVVWDAKEDYNKAHNQEKLYIAQKRVLDVIEAKGGRVLELYYTNTWGATEGQRRKSRTGLGSSSSEGGESAFYVVITKARALEKTCQALREKKNLNPPSGYEEYCRNKKGQNKTNESEEHCSVLQCTDPPHEETGSTDDAPVADTTANIIEKESGTDSAASSQEVIKKEEQKKTRALKPKKKSRTTRGKKGKAKVVEKKATKSVGGKRVKKPKITTASIVTPHADEKEGIHEESTTARSDPPPRAEATAGDWGESAPSPSQAVVARRLNFGVDNKELSPACTFHPTVLNFPHPLQKNQNAASSADAHGGFFRDPSSRHEQGDWFAQNYNPSVGTVASGMKNRSSGSIIVGRGNLDRDLHKAEPGIDSSPVLNDDRAQSKASLIAHDDNKNKSASLKESSTSVSDYLSNPSPASNSVTTLPKPGSSEPKARRNVPAGKNRSKQTLLPISPRPSQPKLGNGGCLFVPPVTLAQNKNGVQETPTWNTVDGKGSIDEMKEMIKSFQPPVLTLDSKLVNVQQGKQGNVLFSRQHSNVGFPFQAQEAKSTADTSPVATESTGKRKRGRPRKAESSKKRKTSQTKHEPLKSGKKQTAKKHENETSKSNSTRSDDKKNGTSSLPSSLDEIITVLPPNLTSLASEMFRNSSYQFPWNGTDRDLDLLEPASSMNIPKPGLSGTCSRSWLDRDMQCDLTQLFRSISCMSQNAVNGAKHNSTLSKKDEDSSTFNTKSDEDLLQEFLENEHFMSEVRGATGELASQLNDNATENGRFHRRYSNFQEHRYETATRSDEMYHRQSILSKEFSLTLEPKSNHAVSNDDVIHEERADDQHECDVIDKGVNSASPRTVTDAGSWQGGEAHFVANDVPKPPCLRSTCSLSGISVEPPPLSMRHSLQFDEIEKELDSSFSAQGQRMGNADYFVDDCNQHVHCNRCVGQEDQGSKRERFMPVILVAVGGEQECQARIIQEQLGNFLKRHPNHKFLGPVQVAQMEGNPLKTSHGGIFVKEFPSHIELKDVEKL